MARLKKHYDTQLKDQLMQKLGLKNKFEVPKLTKIVVNIGVGEAAADSKKIDSASSDLATITGQKPIVTKAKKSIAGFKIREGMALGVSVTLRNKIMYEFLDRLINIAIPRIRDFRGLQPNSFDGNGNYSFGIKEQIIFPEINYDNIDKVRGLNITICTTAKNNEDGLELLRNFNMPFKGNETI